MPHLPHLPHLGHSKKLNQPEGHDQSSSNPMFGKENVQPRLRRGTSVPEIIKEGFHKITHLKNKNGSSSKDTKRVSVKRKSRKLLPKKNYLKGPTHPYQLAAVAIVFLVGVAICLYGLFAMSSKAYDYGQEHINKEAIDQLQHQVVDGVNLIRAKFAHSAQAGAEAVGSE